MIKYLVLREQGVKLILFNSVIPVPMFTVLLQFDVEEELDVNTIGFSIVPSAISFAPRSMIRDPLVSLSPRITVPGSMVKVAPSRT